MIKLGLYKHYKGKQYEVIGICRHSETKEALVLYKALYGEYRLWVRPYKMFTEKVNQSGAYVDRFKFLAPTNEVAASIES